MSLDTVNQTACFGGTQGVYRHPSTVCRCEMTFAVFLPAQARKVPVPVLWYLSGLTCTHENAMTKAGAQAWAAREGLALVFPDTSPRGEDVADHEDYDLGQGAGFYIDANQAPWQPHFQMRRYIRDELSALVLGQFPLRAEAMGITGHSMGGHGALTLAIENPATYRSVSAFAPICHPTASDWGRKQFTAYLGADETAWQAFDASVLMRAHGYDGPVLVDQGGADNFANLLMTESLSKAMDARGQAGQVRLHEGYDHSYFFVASFMAEHIAHHSKILHAV
ncbi:MAG: S-formylglutathione hydrolase [Pseudomonadota bacterium]